MISNFQSQKSKKLMFKNKSETEKIINFYSCDYKPSRIKNHKKLVTNTW
jgi:hypothetical protein